MKMLFKFLMSNFHQSFPLYLCILYPVLRSPYSEDMKTFTCIIQSRGITSYVVVVFQSLSLVRLFATLWTAAHQASLSFTISWSLLKLMFIESVMLFNHLILCCPLLLLLSIFSNIRIFSNESTLHIRWPNIGASASVLPMSIQGWFLLGLTGLIFFAVQATLKGLLQHHSLKASAFFMVQLSHLYMTTGKTIALTIQTLLAKWCLCFLIHWLDLS